MIRSGGEYIQPEEVEPVLRSHPAVRDVAVVGVTDPKWGQIAVACVAGEAGAAPAIDLDRLCRESRVANFKRPRGYVYSRHCPGARPASYCVASCARSPRARASGEDAVAFHDVSPGSTTTAERS